MFRFPCRPFGLFLSCLWSPLAMAAPPATQARSFHLDAPPAQVFPLFTALGERAWAPGWEPQLLSGETGRGSAFRTIHGNRPTTWIVTDYRPAEGRVSYARLAQDSNIGLVDVVCTPAAGGTEVSVRYTLTGLNPEGEAFVRDFLDSTRYSEMIEEWHGATRAALSR